MRISDWSSDVCSSDLHVLFGKLRERHLDHPDRAFDERLARGDHRLRLLTAQHRVSNFGGLSQMGEAAFVTGYPGYLEPRDHFAPQFAADLFVLADTRDFLMFELVIGVARASLAHRRFELAVYESHVGQA